MLAVDGEMMSAFLKQVGAGPRPFSTLAVWNAISTFIEWDTGVLTCSHRQLARASGIGPGDVYRALERLIEMGVLIREQKGKYRVHPSIMWRGGLDKRGQAEDTAPRLTLVEGGKLG